MFSSYWLPSSYSSSNPSSSLFLNGLPSTTPSSSAPSRSSCSLSGLNAAAQASAPPPTAPGTTRVRARRSRSPAPPRRQRASFPLHALGASDARPDPVTVAVKAVTGQRVNDVVTTRSKAKHEAPQGAAAPQGAPLPHALTSCTARREPGRAVRFSPSRHRPPTTV